MKLHVKIEMDLDETPLRELYCTNSAEESAIVLRSILSSTKSNFEEQMGADNVKVEVKAVE